MKVLVEMTDTFGGQPNYCWLQRHTLEMPSTLKSELRMSSTATMMSIKMTYFFMCIVIPIT